MMNNFLLVVLERIRTSFWDINTHSKEYAAFYSRNFLGNISIQRHTRACIRVNFGKSWVKAIRYKSFGYHSKYSTLLSISAEVLYGSALHLLKFG